MCQDSCGSSGYSDHKCNKILLEDHLSCVTSLPNDQSDPTYLLIRLLRYSYQWSNSNTPLRHGLKHFSSESSVWHHFRGDLDGSLILAAEATTTTTTTTSVSGEDLELTCLRIFLSVVPDDAVCGRSLFRYLIASIFLGMLDTPLCPS
ncbi:uncharacterized protein LOC121594256 [Anopheles merus]|uniref:uncharacterized protein LOC121594256 n=1 Tax=Anopheles merus TaxID=30066 RepID=UPI001BE4BE28|nr:uncharacterized protein LOC121594256 [Anopheles merus]